MNREFRDYLFSELEKKSPTPKNAAQILVDELDISLSSAYKKIKGDTRLTLEETFALANKFGISLDAAMPRSGDWVLFRYPLLHGAEMSPWRFVDQLIELLTMLSASPDLKIRHTTCEIPVFNYMYYPELAALKLYFFSHSVWNLLGSERPGQVWIDKLMADHNFADKCRRIFDLAAATPTDEYYQVNMFDTTLRQFRFLQETGQVSAAFSDIVFEQLSDMAVMMSDWAENGQKQFSDGRPGASYQLHINDLVFTSIIFLTENQAGRMLFNTFDSPNFMICEDERVLDRMEAWFNRMKNKSTQISRQNEKLRQVFFTEIQRRVIEMKQKTGSKVV